jgi:hexokinase
MLKGKLLSEKILEINIKIVKLRDQGIIHLSQHLLMCQSIYYQIKIDLFCNVINIKEIKISKNINQSDFTAKE